MFSTLRNFFASWSRPVEQRRAPPARVRSRLTLEQLEDRTLPSVAFALGTNNQVYESIYDANGRVTSGWMLPAPGQFTAIATGTYGPNSAPFVFGMGMDQRI